MQSNLDLTDLCENAIAVSGKCPLLEKLHEFYMV